MKGTADINNEQGKEMDEKERLIISHLRKDARLSLGLVSHTLNVPLSTVYDKINRLQREGVIRKQALLLDFAKLGYHHHIHLVLKVSKEQKLAVQQFLQNHSAVNSLHEINGGYDFLVEVISKDIKEYTDFRNNLKESFDLKEIHEYQIIEELEKEKFC